MRCTIGVRHLLSEGAHLRGSNSSPRNRLLTKNCTLKSWPRYLTKTLRTKKYRIPPIMGTSYILKYYGIPTIYGYIKNIQRYWIHEILWDNIMYLSKYLWDTNDIGYILKYQWDSTDIGYITKYIWDTNDIGYEVHSKILWDTNGYQRYWVHTQILWEIPTESNDV